MALTTVLWYIVALFISSMPLHLAARMMGSTTGFLSTVGINLLAGILVGFLEVFAFPFSGMLAFLLLLFIYRAFFQIGWMRALLVWVIQLIIVYVVVLLMALVGITGLALAFV